MIRLHTLGLMSSINSNTNLSFDCIKECFLPQLKSPHTGQPVNECDMKKSTNSFSLFQVSAENFRRALTNKNGHNSISRCLIFSETKAIYGLATNNNCNTVYRNVGRRKQNISRYIYWQEIVDVYLLPSAKPIQSYNILSC